MSATSPSRARPHRPHAPDSHGSHGSHGTREPGPRHRPGPTPEEARDLIATSRHDDDPSTREQALETVVRGHLPLAHGLAHRYGHRGIDDDELEQVAALALVKAIQRYDLSATTPFGAFATPTITGELRRHFRDHGWLVRPPRPLQEQRQEMVRLRQDLTARLGREPEDIELASALEVSVETLRRIRIADQNLRPASLDAPAPTSQATLLDVLAPLYEPAAPDLDERLVVREAVGLLSRLEQQLIHLRYTQDLTQREIADVLKLTPMAVSRLQRRTLETLARRLVAMLPDGASA